MNNFRLPAIALQLQESSAPAKIQLFRVGKFYHAEYGEFEITPKTLAEIKKNFEAKVRGIDLALDYRHDNEDVAAAWIKSLELQDDGKSLWAEVDWTPRGKQVVQDKEFRYISPEFSFAYKDNETLKDHGPTLLGAGLTNRPVIKKMEPVAQLSEYKADGSKEKQPLKQGESKMNEPKKLADMSPEEMMKMIQELQAKIADYEKKDAAAAAEKAMAEKKSKFATLLKEGKVIAAQEESYLSGDMVKFIELSKPVNLAEGGNPGGTTKEAGAGGKTVDEQIHELAEKKIAEKQATDLGDAYNKVLKENPELRKQKYGNR